MHYTTFDQSQLVLPCIEMKQLYTVSLHTYLLHCLQLRIYVNGILAAYVLIYNDDDDDNNDDDNDTDGWLKQYMM